jgi:CubicO group peptidase (beta-lactamase class C family)
LILLLLALAAAAPSPSVETRIERVTRGLLPDTSLPNRFGPPAALQDRMAYFHTPGVSIAVINDGRIEWARGFGIRERGRPEPVTERTLFQAGSISKPIFALAVMRLVQEGRLDLDEDVNRYLTSWKVPPTGDWQPRVTLRQILGHAAGFTVHGFPGYTVTEPRPSAPQILDAQPPTNTPAVRVDIIPGVQLRYSGGGITVAQQAVADALKEAFPALMRRLLLDPVEMKDSTYEQPLPPERAAAAATAHPWKGVPLEGKWHVYPEMAAAGLWTTPSDLARAGVEMQRALRGESKRLLSAETATKMLAPSAVSPDIGIGFFLSGKDKAVRFGHGGWDEGFVAEMTVYKDLGIGAVVMVNSNEGQPLLQEIQRSIAREYNWPGYIQEERTEAQGGSTPLERFAGAYEAKSGFSCSVTVQGDRLALTPRGQAPIGLFRENDTKFFVKTLDAEVAFEMGENGEVKALTLTQNGRPLSADRRP